MRRGSELQLWCEKNPAPGHYRVFPYTSQMVLSLCLHQPVTSDVQLSLVPLSVKRPGKKVSTFKSEVVLLPQNKVACGVRMRGKQLYQVKESVYLGGGHRRMSVSGAR